MNGSMRAVVRGFLRYAAAPLLAVATTFTVASDKFPARNMEMIVPWGPGGGADTLGRLVARWLETDLKTTMPVLNLPGAGGSIGLGKMIVAPADGHMLGVLTSDTILYATLDPAKLKMNDMTLLAILTRQPSGFFVRNDSRFKTWADVVAEAKTKPVSFATTGPNSPDDLAVALVEGKGSKTVSVAYPKPGDRYASVLGGHVDVLFEQAGDVKGYLDAKTMRPLMFFASQRLPAPFADVPVSAELGYDLVPPQLRAIVVRTGTDPKAMEALAKSVERFAASPGYQAFLRDQLAEPDSYAPTARSTATVTRDVDSLKAIARQLPATASK